MKSAHRLGLVSNRYRFIYDRASFDVAPPTGLYHLHRDVPGCHCSPLYLHLQALRTGKNVSWNQLQMQCEVVNTNKRVLTILDQYVNTPKVFVCKPRPCLGYDNYYLSHWSNTRRSTLRAQQSRGSGVDTHASAKSIPKSCKRKHTHTHRVDKGEWEWNSVGS